MMLQQFLQDFGYFALFLGTFFEGETILVLAGFLAFRGYMQLDTVILTAFLGSYAGDQLWYFLGRRHGRRLLARKPRWQKLGDKALDHVRRHPDLWVLSFRFVYGLRTVMPVAIGLSALVITVFAMAGSLVALTLLRRFVLKLDRYGLPRGSEAAREEEAHQAGKADNSLTLWIVIAVVLGMLAGRFVLPAAVTVHCGTIINFGLYLLLFMVGMDMGKQGTFLSDVKTAGFQVLLVPVAVCLGSLVCAAVAGIFLPLGIKDSMAAASGMGWYSLAPTLLAPYSLSVSAVAFLSNVMREIFSIISIPFVAKYIGYVECASLPGAAAMDTVLPVVVGATHERITIYSFTSGVVLSLAVPILVPAIVAIPF